MGQRVEKQFAAAGRGRRTVYPVRFAYDMAGHMIGEYDYGAVVTVQETIWMGDTPVAVIRNGVVHYIHSDHLGTPRAIKVASTNRTVWRWVGEPFGATQAQEDVDGDGIDFPFNMRFPGQYLDKESGIVQNWFRDYHAATGRYLQSDPIGLAGGFNTYSYVGGNPISRVDPSGLWSFSAELYKILGGGVVCSCSNGKLEVAVRIGFGGGGGAGFDPLGIAQK